MTAAVFIAALLVLLVLIYLGQGYWAWVGAAAVLLAGWAGAGANPAWLFALILVGTAAAALVFGVPALRRPLVSTRAMKLMARALPSLGETEQVALKAGSVWWEGELFSGRPEYSKLLGFAVQPLSQEERAFLDGPVQELCARLDDWQITQDRDLSPAVWEFIKEQRFLGMIIPKRFGGLEFSAAAHAAVVTRITTRSGPAAVTVMVPNSLGPAELLLHYGTRQQQDHYLPRLARGEEIPSFALTEPHAGSDAASGRSTGVVCRGQWEGQEITGIRLCFDKRYITLAPVATVIGLAFRLYDPDGLLEGSKEDIGITCALIPRHTPGLEVGRRHDPMGIPFQNGPVRGTDVFVPLDYIIGGPEYAGQGWRMLMEQLSAGRGISLPSRGVGAPQMAARATGAYGLVREQFGLPIARFEGVRERLARIAGHAYFMKAAARLTAGAVDAGESPSVVSAITKAYLTDCMRVAVNDGMDLMAGAAISRGPRNILSRLYIAIPIGITVEGANILSRSMIIFGQGAMRCHPFLLQEVEAIGAGDVKAFDAALFGHLNHLSRNKVRAALLAVTGGRAAAAPVSGPAARYFRHLSRLSAAFAFTADTALVTLGGSLKRREYLSGRFADVLAWMYLASAVLKYHHDEDNPRRDDDLLHWAAQYCLYQSEQALLALLENLPGGLLRLGMKALIFPFGARLRPPRDRLADALAQGLTDPDSGVRDFLTPDVFVPDAAEPGLGELEAAHSLLARAGPARAKVMQARRADNIRKGIMENMAREAREQGLITDQELAAIAAAQEAVDRVVQVNDFDPEEFSALR